MQAYCLCMSTSGQQQAMCYADNVLQQQLIAIVPGSAASAAQVELQDPDKMAAREKKFGKPLLSAKDPKDPEAMKKRAAKFGKPVVASSTQTDEARKKVRGYGGCISAFGFFCFSCISHLEHVSLSNQQTGMCVRSSDTATSACVACCHQARLERFAQEKK